MNTVFVSGTLNKPAQVNVSEHGYLLTFNMLNYDECADSSGKIKQVLTPWTVSLSYDYKPVNLLNRLREGMKVLVKGDAKIDYKEIDQEYKLDCALMGEHIDILDTPVNREVQFEHALSDQEWDMTTAIAS